MSETTGTKVEGEVNTLVIMKALEQRLKDAEGALADMTRDRDRLQASDNRVRSENEKLRQTAASKDLITENKGLREEISQAHKEATALKKDLQQRTAEIEAARKDLPPLRRQIEGLQSTAVIMQGQRDEAQRQRGEALGETVKLREDMSAAQSKIKELEAAIGVAKKGAAEKIKVTK